jgi:hypothetical protein
MRGMDYAVTGAGAHRTITPRRARAKQRTRETLCWKSLRANSHRRMVLG